MGTSRTFRSPSTPRWQALNAAYDAQLPLERLRVLVFAAGEGPGRRRSRILPSARRCRR